MSDSDFRFLQLALILISFCLLCSPGLIILGGCTIFPPCTGVIEGEVGGERWKDFPMMIKTTFKKCSTGLKDAFPFINIT